MTDLIRIIGHTNQSSVDCLIGQSPIFMRMGGVTCEAMEGTIDRIQFFINYKTFDFKLNEPIILDKGEVISYVILSRDLIRNIVMHPKANWRSILRDRKVHHCYNSGSVIKDILNNAEDDDSPSNHPIMPDYSDPAKLLESHGIKITTRILER